MLSYEIGNLFKHVTQINTELFFNVFTLCNILTIMLFLPILNHLIIPCFPTLSMKARVGFGVALNTFAVVVAAIVEGCVHKESFERQLLWLLLPSTLLAIAEVLVSLTCK